MSIELARNHLKKFNLEDRVIEFIENTATVELAGFVLAIITLGEPPAAALVVAVFEPSDVPRPPPIASSIIPTPLENASVTRPRTLSRARLSPMPPRRAPISISPRLPRSISPRPALPSNDDN